MATDSLPDVVVLMGVLSVVAFASLPLLARRSGKAAPTAELTAARVVTFAGYEWMIVNGSGQSPCSSYCCSDSGQSVWIDYVGRLHMKLRCVGNEWLCCELVCQESPGFGRYEFRVEGRLDRLDPNVELDLSLEAVDTVAASDGSAFRFQDMVTDCDQQTPSIKFALWKFQDIDIVFKTVLMTSPHTVLNGGRLQFGFRVFVAIAVLWIHRNR